MSGRCEAGWSLSGASCGLHSGSLRKRERSEWFRGVVKRSRSRRRARCRRRSAGEAWRGACCGCWGAGGTSTGAGSAAGSGAGSPRVEPGDAGQLVLEVVHVGQVGRELGQLVERGDADALEEVGRGPVEVRAAQLVLAGLLDQPAGQERAHDAVDVDAADRRHPRARHRLLVGDHRQRLEGGPGEPRLLPFEHERLDDAGELRARVEPPPAGHRAQVEAAALLGVLPRQRLEGGLDRLDRVPDHGGQAHRAEGLVGDHQDRLERRAQLGDRHVQRVDPVSGPASVPVSAPSTGPGSGWVLSGCSLTGPPRARRRLPTAWVHHRRPAGRRRTRRGCRPRRPRRRSSAR